MGYVYFSAYFVGTIDIDYGPGTHYINSNTGGRFIQKIDTFGNFVWVGRLSATQAMWITSLAVDVSGNVLITGRFKKTGYFHPSNIVAISLTSLGTGTDIFICK